jgi:hypothetical protein
MCWSCFFQLDLSASNETTLYLFLAAVGSLGRFKPDAGRLPAVIKLSHPLQVMKSHTLGRQVNRESPRVACTNLRVAAERVEKSIGWHYGLERGVEQRQWGGQPGGLASGAACKGDAIWPKR